MSLNLINKDQFVGYFNIQFSTAADDFTSYADQTEKFILSEAFGSSMYDDMLANPTEQKYIDLIANYHLADLLRDMFYYYYLRDRESYSSTLGQFSSEAENATRNKLSRNQKITTVYDQGLELYRLATEHVSENQDIYDKYTDTIHKREVNAWGIDTDMTGVNFSDYSFLTGFCSNKFYTP